MISSVTDEKTLELKISRKYNTDFNLRTKTKFLLKPGITNLIGCNGYGKSTLLKQIRAACKQKGIPVFYYDDRTDGGSRLIEKHMLCDNISAMAGMLMSSEGERVRAGVGSSAGPIRNFVHEARQRKDKRCVLLFDSVDSGASVDSIMDIKNAFNIVIEDTKDLELYLIVASNSYEMTLGLENFDPIKLSYRKKFSSYNAFSKFIMRTRTVVEERYRRAERAARLKHKEDRY